MRGPHRTGALVILLVFLASGPLAAGEGGGGGSDEGGGDTMTYITIAVAVVVGGLLILDAIAGEDETPVSEDLILAEEQSTATTGIDWESTFPDPPEGIVLGVSVLNGEDRLETSTLLLQAVMDASPDEITVFTDPIDLGSIDPLQGALMASEYFDVTYLVYVSELPGDSVEVGVASPDSILWTSRCSDGMSFEEPANQLMEADLWIR